MTSIDYVTLEVADRTASENLYQKAWGLGDRIRVRTSQEPTNGFRGFTMSLVVPQPATVRSLVDAALDAGATSLKPAEKSFWGYGGAVQAADGTIWTIASSSKKDTAPDNGEISDVVLLLGVSDVKETKKFYVDQGLRVKRSFGSKYVEFDGADSAITLSLYGRRALAKHAGVSPEGSGSHRLAIGSDSTPFTDPDGFSWEAGAPIAS